jgi:hypothetical protein
VEIEASDNVGGSGLDSNSPATDSYTFGEGSDQTHTFTVTDVAGNSANVTSAAVNVDLTAPTLTQDINTADPITGWYNLSTGPAKITYTASDATSGVSTPDSYTFSDGTDLSYAGIMVTDVAGNTSLATADVTGIKQDTVAPAAPTGLALAPASDSGVSNSDRITNVKTPTITGTAEAGSTVTLYDGTNVLGTATADSGGTWSITSAISLADGTHSLTAKATDVAGNTSPDSTALSVTIDTTGPTTSAVTVFYGKNGSQYQLRVNASGSDTLSNIVAAEFYIDSTTSGAHYSMDGSPAFNTSCTESLSRAINSTSPILASGNHTIYVRCEDAAGNWGAFAFQTITV